MKLFIDFQKPTKSLYMYTNDIHILYTSVIKNLPL